MLDVYAKIKVFIHSGMIRKSVMISKEKKSEIKITKKMLTFYLYIFIYFFVKQ